MVKGWKSESARHSLARKGIETGRKKQRAAQIICQTCGGTGATIGLVGDDMDEVRCPACGGTGKITGTLIRATKKKQTKPVLHETLFTDFFSGLGEMFVAKTRETGEKTGIGLLGATKKASGAAGDVGDNFITSIMGIGENLISPKKKKGLEE